MAAGLCSMSYVGSYRFRHAPLLSLGLVLSHVRLRSGDLQRPGMGGSMINSLNGNHVGMDHCRESESGKTHIYRVIANVSSVILGEISWHAPWRRYVFKPNRTTLYDWKCMNEIAEFLVKLTDDHKQSIKNKKGKNP